jgi:predicted RNA methylase
VLRTLLPAIGLGSDDVLLEYGSGKGRVVITVASRYRLRRVIGVDHDRDAIAAARANLRNWRRPLRCPAVVFIREDAREFEVPDDVTVVYMFNPFVGVTFSEVLARLRASLARRPRPLRVVYLYPFMHDEVVEAGFTVVRSHEDLFYPWTVYSIG